MAFLQVAMPEPANHIALAGGILGLAGHQRHLRAPGDPQLSPRRCISHRNSPRTRTLPDAMQAGAQFVHGDGNEAAALFREAIGAELIERPWPQCIFWPAALGGGPAGQLIHVASSSLDDPLPKCADAGGVKEDDAEDALLDGANASEIERDGRGVVSLPGQEDAAWRGHEHLALSQPDATLQELDRLMLEEVRRCASGRACPLRLMLNVDPCSRTIPVRGRAAGVA